MKRSVFLWVVCCMFAAKVMAQKHDDTERKWAVSLHGNANWLQAVKNESSLSARQMGMGWKLMAEYYLPNAPFSLKAGYDEESFEAFSSSLSASLKQICVGGRYYIPVSGFPLKPFVGADALLTVNALNHDGHVEIWGYRGNQLSLITQRDLNARCPRFSLSPQVGLDIYLLSCLALQLEYGFRMGMGSHVTVYSQDVRAGKTYETRFNGMRHVLSIGVKVNFPFRWTQNDMETVIDWILGD